MAVTQEEVFKLMQYEDDILDVIYKWEEFTTSDLQGAVMAIVMNVYNEGKKANKVS